MRKRNILLVDDHAVFREGLSLIIGLEKDLAVCGECADALSALKEAPALRPELAIVDISMDGMNGLELTKHLRAKLPRLRILILSMHPESMYAERALRAGANGYIMKQRSRRELIHAVRAVLKGETYVSQAVNEQILQNMTPGRAGAAVERLSHREFDVFQLMARGYATRHMAESLHVSAKTIGTHRERIREKLGMKSAFDLVQYAHDWAAGQSRP